MFKNFDRFMCVFLGGSFMTFVQLAFGGLDKTFIFLLICMALDMLTGMLVGASNHELSSKRCFTGLSKKLFILIYVLIAHQIDVVLDLNYVRLGVCYMYIVNDILSIIENGSALGVPVPAPIKKALEILNEKEDDF